MKAKQSAFLLRVLSIVLCCSVVYVVKASPIISIGEGGNVSWQQALANGANDGITPTPAGAPTQAAIDFYTDQINNSPNVSSFQFFQPDLYVNNNVQDNAGDGHDSLVMQWEAIEDPEVLSIASWDYTYGIDPDFSNMRVHFSLLAPVGIWDVSLELIDINGNAVGWFLPGPVNGIWQDHWIKAYNLQDQGNWEFYDGSGGAFDITQVIAIRLNESGMFSPQIPFAPAPGGGPVPQTPIFWNAWNHLVVKAPEPESLMLFVLGVLMVVYQTRKRSSCIS